MANIGLAGYQMNQPTGLSAFFQGANTAMNQERLGLAREQLDMQRQQAEAEAARQNRRAKALSEYFGGREMTGGLNYTQNPDPGLPALPVGAESGVPGMDGQGDVGMTGYAVQPETRQVDNKYAALAAAGIPLDDIRGMMELERQGRQDELDLFGLSATMTAQAAQMVSRLPEDQRPQAWMDATRQIEQVTGTDIPDNYQQYSPEALNAVMAQAVPVADWYAKQNPDSTAAWKNYQNARQQGYDGSFMDYQTELKRSGATNVTVGPDGAMTQEEFARRTRAEAMAKAVGQAAQERVKSMAEASDRARSQLEALETMQSLVGDIKTGTLGETALEVQKAADRLGINLDISGDTSAAELFGALSNQMTLLQRPPGSGEMSNSDRDFFRDATANLSTTPEGNALLIDLAMRRAQRTMELEGRYQEYLDDQMADREDRTWAQVRREYLDTNPLFTEKDRAMVRAATARSKAETPDANVTRFDNMPRDELMAIEPGDLNTVEELEAYTRSIQALSNE